MKQITVRLTQGADLKNEIDRLAKEHGMKAGCISGVVGSLSLAKLRMAGAKEIKSWEEELEIVSGTGTVSENGSHVHIAVSDKNGTTLGGHLVVGSLVRTTVELILFVFDDVVYTREEDVNTGFKELAVKVR